MILFSAIRKGTKYEVRQAGASLRLYTDGVFHSQWNPNRPFSGHLWDLLFLPVFLSESFSAAPSGLILGLGGGTVINLFSVFFPGSKIVAVDLDKTHIALAKKYFIADTHGIKFVHDDAINYVNTREVDSGIAEKFSFILDDLFCASPDKREAVRAVGVDQLWLKQLNERLNPQGVLVFNFENGQQLRASLRKASMEALGFRRVYEFTSPRYENAIGVCIKVDLSKSQLLDLLHRKLESYPKKYTRELLYTLKRVH